PCEVVADELLAALEQVRLRLLLRHPRDALEGLLLRGLRVLQVVLELAEMRLPVREPLVLPVELDELPLDLLLLREQTLLDLQHRFAAVGELPVDLGAHLHSHLARLDLRFATERLRVALGVLEELPAQPLRLADAGGTERLHRDERERRPDGDPDDDCDPDQHVPAPRSVGELPPGIGPAAAAPSETNARFDVRAARAPAVGRTYPAENLRWSRSARVVVGVVTKSALVRKSSGLQAKCQVEPTDRSAVTPRPQIGRAPPRPPGRSRGRRADGAPSASGPRGRGGGARARPPARAPRGRPRPARRAPPP